MLTQEHTARDGVTSELAEESRRRKDEFDVAEKEVERVERENAALKSDLHAATSDLDDLRKQVRRRGEGEEEELLGRCGGGGQSSC